MLIGGWIVRFHKISTTVVVIVVFILSLGLKNLELDADYTAYFDQGDPLIAIDEEINQRYELHDSVVVILQSEKGSLLDEPVWSQLTALTADLESLPNVVQVLSATNYSNQVRGEIESSAQTTQAEVFDTTAVPYTGNQSPGRTDLILSGDKSHTLINVGYQLPDNLQPIELLEVFDSLRSTVNRAFLESEYPVTAYYTGTLALNEAYIMVVRHDLRLFLPGLLVAFLICLYGFYRRARVVVAIMAVALLSVLAAFGVVGWTGFPLASIHTFVPVIIVTISIAGSVHLVTSFFDVCHGEGASQSSRLKQIVGLNLVPLTLTCLSTAAGFLALTTSPSPPVQRVGLIVAIGVAFSWALNLSMLLGMLPKQVNFGNIGARLTVNMKPFVRISTHFSKTVLVIFTVLAGIAIYGSSKSTIDDNVFSYFDESLPFSQATQLANTYFGGVQELSYEVHSRSQETALDSSYLARVDEAAVWLRTLSDVRRVVAVPDFLPKTEQESTLVYPGSMTDRENWWVKYAPRVANQFMSKDKKASRILVSANGLDATKLINLDNQIKQKLDQLNAPAQVRGGTGTSLLFAHLGKRNANSMVVSLGCALVLISLIIGLLAKSVRVVLVSLICNILPVALIFSLWALNGGYISLGAAIVMGMIIGIVVDDTVYILNRYLRAKRSKHHAPVQKAVSEVGPALVITSTTLCVGLSIGLLSDFLPIYTMSLMSVAIIAAALIADIVLLPVLLSVGSKREPNSNEVDGLMLK